VRLRAKRGTLKHRLLHIVDRVGAMLFIASISCFLIGTSWVGQMYPWSSWNTYVPITLGVAGVVGTLVWERYGAETHFIHLKARQNIIDGGLGSWHVKMTTESRGKFCVFYNELGSSV
jgi:hypothetical protein